jgi:hypothetical protein
MSAIFISNVAGRKPTVNQLLLADSRMGYNQSDGILYVLRIVGNFKTVVAVNGTNAPVTYPPGDFKGTAYLSTNPGTPSGDEWWTAAQIGVYTNFGGVEITTMTDVLNYLKWTQETTSWSIETVDIPSGNLHNRLHSMISALDHAPASVSDYGKIVRVNPTTGAWELITLIEDISFEYPDIVYNLVQTYILDLKASFAYIILSAVLQGDQNMNDVAVKINGASVTGLGAIDVTSAISDTEALGANTVNIGDKVTLVTSGVSTFANYLTGKIRIRRI